MDESEQILLRLGIARGNLFNVVAIDHNFRPVRPIGLFEVEGLRACAVVCKIFETLHTFLPVRPMIG